MRPGQCGLQFIFMFLIRSARNVKVPDSTDMDALDVPLWSQTGCIILLVRHHLMGPSRPSPWQRRRKPTLTESLYRTTDVGSTQRRR